MPYRRRIYFCTPERHIPKGHGVGHGGGLDILASLEPRSRQGLEILSPKLPDPRMPQVPILGIKPYTPKKKTL